MVVRVKEKEMIGYIKLKGKYINFDRQGIIRIITDNEIEGVPFIEGISVKEAFVGEKLKGVNTRKLNTILSVGKMLEKTEQKPDRLLFNDMKQLVLYYGDIEVRLGDDENMDEKMNRLIGILPELAGMQGILHLENITETTETVVFDSAQETEGDEKDLASGDDTEKAGQDSTDKKDDKDSQKQDKDKKPEDKKPEDKKSSSSKTVDSDKDSNEDEDNDSELDYSDGSDAAE